MTTPQDPKTGSLPTIALGLWDSDNLGGLASAPTTVLQLPATPPGGMPATPSLPVDALFTMSTGMRLPAVPTGVIYLAPVQVPPLPGSPRSITSASLSSASIGPAPIAPPSIGPASVGPASIAPGDTAALPLRTSGRAPGVRLVPQRRLPPTVLPPTPVGPPVVVEPLAPARPDRRSSDPVAKLTRQFDSLCVRAVDPLEIAAGLEAAGWNDQRAQEVTGVHDVFALAWAMFRQVPARGRSVKPASPWVENVPLHLLRGLIYALPALLFSAAHVGVAGTGQQIVLTLSLILGWSGSQALTYAAQMAIGWGAAPAARALLRNALGVTLPVTTLSCLTLWLSGRTGSDLAVLAALLPVYMLSASILMVTQRERLVLWTLLGGGAVALAGAMAFGPVGGRIPSVITVLYITAVAVRSVGGLSLARAGWGALTKHGRSALWHAAWGVCSAVAVIEVTASLPSYVAQPALIFLALWMGPAEWLMHYLRRSAWTLLHDGTDVAAVGGTLRRQLLGLSALWAVLFTLPVMLAAVVAHGPVGEVLPGAFVVAALAFGLLQGLIGISLGRVREAVLLAAGVVLPAAALLLAGYSAVGLWSFVGLAVGEAVVAARVVGRPSSHL